jgi:hypothetical protein
VSLLIVVCKALAELASATLAYINNRQLMQAGAAQSVLDGERQADDAIRKAAAARGGVRHDADGVRTDPDNRDDAGR